jgi:hypothetical protein
MRDIIDVKGASGAVYRFTRFRDGSPLSAMGGNYIYARQHPTGPEILFAGEAQNLLTGARARWAQAVREHAAEELFTRLNISEHTRKREHADIAAAEALPMNGALARQGAGAAQ